MTIVKREYRGKDVECIITCETIVENAITLEAFLTPSRPQWASPYFENLKTEIQGVYISALGVDNAQAMREATTALLSLMTPAAEALRMFKVQLEVDFANNIPRKNEILTVLGYTQHYKDVQRKDQEAFVELLTKFDVNMTPALQTELNAAGIPTVVISKVTDFATNLKNANITQEVAKGLRKNISSEAVEEINTIYRKTIAISKIGAIVFKNDQPNKDRLTYTKVLRTLNYQGSSTPPPPPES